MNVMYNNNDLLLHLKTISLVKMYYNKPPYLPTKPFRSWAKLNEDAVAICADRLTVTVRGVIRMEVKNKE